MLKNILGIFKKSFGDSPYHVFLDEGVKRVASKFLDEVFQLQRERTILAIDCYGNIFFTLHDEKNILYGLSINKREDDFFIFRSFIFTYDLKKFHHFINPISQEIVQIHEDEKTTGARSKQDIIVKEFNKWQSDINKMYLQNICAFYEEVLSKSQFDKSRLDIYELGSLEENKFFTEKIYNNDDIVYEFENLKIMILKYSYFSKKIKKIRNLSSLRLLEINNNKFIHDIVKLSYLINLELSFVKNTRGKFSDLQKLTHLKYLQIANCKTIDLKAIGNCKQLNSLHVSQTRLEHVGALDIKNLYSLRIIDCENFDFKDICHLNSLEELCIVSCQIDSLDGIEKLVNLKSLNLSYNKITLLPDEVVKLSSLEKINLENNFLDTLPKALGTLPLNLLKLKNNPFKTLPLSLHKLSQEVIDLEFKNIALYDTEAKSILDEFSKGECFFEHDINLKLMVIQKLMYEYEILLPKFDIYDFAKEHALDLEKIGYDIIPQALQYFKNLPIDKRLLLEIQELDFDGSNEIYSQLVPYCEPHWDELIVKNIQDIKHLVNLRRVNPDNFTKEQINELDLIYSIGVTK